MPPDDFQLISTEYREAIARELAFPIGSELISKALAGLDQYDVLQIWFRSIYAPFGVTPAYYQRRAESGGFLRIMGVTYRNIPPGRSGSRSMIEEGFYEESWKIHVYPVLREHKSVVRKKLVEYSLPWIREWLQKPRDEAWRQGRKTIDILFRPMDDAIRQREVNPDRR